MAKDAQNWVTNCRRCQIAWGDYNQPKPTIGHLEAHNPLDLVCLDITKIDPSKTGKENMFTKFSLAMCTPNQTAKTVAKILVEKWFHVYGVPLRIHSYQGRCFDSNIIKALCKMYGVEQSLSLQMAIPVPCTNPFGWSWGGSCHGSYIDKTRR